MVQIIKSKIKKVNNHKLKKKKVGGGGNYRQTIEGSKIINPDEINIDYYLFIFMYYYSQNKLSTQKYRLIIQNLINELTDLCGKTPERILERFKSIFLKPNSNIKQNDYILIKESNVYILYVKYHIQWYKIDGSITEINDLPKDINTKKIIITSKFPPRNNSLDYDLTIHTFPYKKPRLFIDDSNNVIYYILQYLFLNRDHVEKISNIYSGNIIRIINNEKLDISFDDILYFRENMMYNLTYQNDKELIIDDIDNINTYYVIDMFSKKTNQHSILDSNYLTIQKKEKNLFQKKLCLTKEDTSIKLLCDKFIYLEKQSMMHGGTKIFKEKLKELLSLYKNDKLINKKHNSKDEIINFLSKVGSKKNTYTYRIPNDSAEFLLMIINNLEESDRNFMDSLFYVDYSKINKINSITVPGPSMKTNQIMISINEIKDKDIHFGNNRQNKVLYIDETNKNGKIGSQDMYTIRSKYYLLQINYVNEIKNNKLIQNKEQFKNNKDNFIKKLNVDLIGIIAKKDGDIEIDIREGGHYISYIKNQEKWTEINDAQIIQLNMDPNASIFDNMQTEFYPVVLLYKNDNKPNTNRNKLDIHGIYNHSNNCYASSALQLLFSIPEFTNYFIPPIIQERNVDELIDSGNYIEEKRLKLDDVNQLVIYNKKNESEVIAGGFMNYKNNFICQSNRQSRLYNTSLNNYSNDYSTNKNIMVGGVNEEKVNFLDDIFDEIGVNKYSSNISNSGFTENFTQGIVEKTRNNSIISSKKPIKYNNIIMKGRSSNNNQTRRINPFQESNIQRQMNIIIRNQITHLKKCKNKLNIKNTTVKEILENINNLNLLSNFTKDLYKLLEYKNGYEKIKYKKDNYYIKHKTKYYFNLNLFNKALNGRLYKRIPKGFYQGIISKNSSHKNQINNYNNNISLPPALPSASPSGLPASSTKTKTPGLPSASALSESPTTKAKTSNKITEDMGVEELYNNFIQGGKSSNIVETHHKNIQKLSNHENGVEIENDIFYFVFKNNPLMIEQCWKSNDNYYYFHNHSYYKLDESETTKIDDENLIPNYNLLKKMIFCDNYLIKEQIKEEELIKLSKNSESNNILNQIDFDKLIQCYILKKRNNNSYPKIKLQELIDKINNNKNLLYHEEEGEGEDFGEEY